MAPGDLQVEGELYTMSIDWSEEGDELLGTGHHHHHEHSLTFHSQDRWGEERRRWGEIKIEIGARRTGM